MPSPSSPALQRLRRLDKSSPGFHDQLYNVLDGKEYVQCAPHLQPDDVVWLVDYLDTVLDALDPSSPASRKCLHELRNLCSTRAILPTSYVLSPHLLEIDPEPFASGGFSDVYKGTLRGSKVGAKRMRVYNKDNSQKIFRQEAVMWKHLAHPNILPLLGVTINPLQLISNWMPNMTLPEYIKKHPCADRLGLLSDVARGLHYLHSRNMIHGGIKGPNILVDDSGHARIADFGHATLVKDEDSVEGDSHLLGYTPRWTAPEILNGQATDSKESDIFSFAMVMIEVFTDMIPFADDSTIMAMLAITQGRRPKRPTHPGVTGGLWKLMQRCWDGDPHSRPEASEVLQTLLDLNPPVWKRLISDTLSTDERIPLIKYIFSDRDEVVVFEYLSRADAQAFIDVVDEALESLDSLPPDIRRSCLRSSYGICGREALLPRSLPIPLCYNPTDTPQTHGGLADVWKGKHNGQEVAAKALRVYQISDLKRIRRWFCKEVVTWKTLRHPNVLPLLGVTVTEDPRRFVMVSEWMENGNIIQFLRRVDANRLKLLEDATEGLIYMHDQGTVHGDLKGLNVMIDKTGRAVLADFSLVALIPDQSTFLSTCLEGGTIQWMGPELLDPEKFGLKNRRPTMESDCYALGMVVYEVLSGQVPFSTYNSFTALRKVLDGERPKRPQGEAGKLFTDYIWDMMGLCWKAKPSERTTATAILLCLKGGPPNMNGDDDQLNVAPVDS